MNELSIKVGKKLRKIRVQDHVSMEEYARRLNITTAALSKMETGVTDIQLRRLYEVAEIYGTSVYDLLSDTTELEEREAKLNLLQTEINSLEERLADLQKEALGLYREHHELKKNKPPISQPGA